jgi:hypothetical protein
VSTVGTVSIVSAVSTEIYASPIVDEQRTPVQYSTVHGTVQYSEYSEYSFVSTQSV